MPKRLLHLVLDVGPVRPLVLTPATVKLVAVMQVLDAGQVVLGSVSVDVAAQLSLAQRTALANFITNAVDALEAVNF